MGSNNVTALSNFEYPILNSDDFDVDKAILTIKALKGTFERRTHKKRNYLGEEVWVAGTLGNAVQLPKITALLVSRSATSRAKGLEAFQTLWSTLSPSTKEKVLDAIGWYEPGVLDWQDKRSNRRPKINDE